MIKKIITLIFCIQISLTNAFAVCPVLQTMSTESVEKELKEHILSSDVHWNHTLIGFVISVENKMLFDECNCLTEDGKSFLNKLAQIMKNSGRQWKIYAHTEHGATQLDRLYTTSKQAGEVTNYLTNIERCLINQIFPIGFGSIMPYQKHNPDHITNERTDFIIEEFNFNR